MGNVPRAGRSGSKGRRASKDLSPQEAQKAQGLISELDESNVLDLVEPITPMRRRWSIGSETDADIWMLDKTISCAGDASEGQRRRIGYACKRGKKHVVANQDSWCALSVERDFSIYAVFDGHGNTGHKVSDYVRVNLPKVLLHHPEFRTNTSRALTDGFLQMQNMIEVANANNELNASLSGTTASVIVHWHMYNKLYIAHCGDSRCCITRHDGKGVKAEVLTEDHRPNDRKEKARIRKGGGQITKDKEDNMHRVYVPGDREAGLNMSRALGDVLFHHDAGLSAEPTVSQYQLKDADAWLVLASDGIWEFLPSQEVATILSTFEPDDAKEAAEKLVDDARDRWIKHEPNKVDDSTAIVIYLGESKPIGAGGA